MTDSGRRPGEISDQAEPIGKPLFTQSRKGEAASARQPGPVEELTEKLDNEQVETIDPLQIPQVFLSRSPWAIVWFLLIFVGVVWLLVESIATLIDLYNYSIYLAIPALVLFFAVVFVVVRAVSREYQAIRSVDHIEERNANLKIAVEDNNWMLFRKEIDPVINNIESRSPELVKEYRAATQDGDSVRDSMRQFENIVLSCLDKEVDALIKNTILTTSVGVAVVPHPALDAGLVLWRGQHLSRQIGVIYGLEPTGLSAWRLMRHTIISAFIAAGIEEFGSVTLEKVISGPWAIAMKPLVETSATALRMYRLGSLTKKICRPTSTSVQNQPDRDEL